MTQVQQFPFATHPQRLLLLIIVEDGTVTVSMSMEMEMRRPHLFMAVVVMVEEFCTFVIIGPRFVGRGQLPRSIVVTPAVC